jgi:hypothetical protein
MSRDGQIRGGAGEFEAAVIAVVLDQIAAEEKSARTGKTGTDNRLPAWVRALQPETELLPPNVKKSE